jgi:hypothetical protein
LVGLLKMAQMQGGVIHPLDGYPGPSEAYPARGEPVEPRSERPSAPTKQMGRFQQPG